MDIKLNPKYEYLRGFIEKIPIIFEAKGEIIYNKRNLIKSLNTPDGLSINIKRYHIPNGINEYVYSWGIRKPKGLRAFVYPEILLSQGVQTPESIAYIEERHFGLLGYSYFISLQCPYEHTMHEIGNAPEGTYEELAAALAKYTAFMHEKHIMHRDYSPGNILWEYKDNRYHFSIVDINRMYFGEVNLEKGCANFKRLWGPKRFFIILVREYAKARGFNPDKAEAIALLYRTKFWEYYGRKHPINFNLEL